MNEIVASLYQRKSLREFLEKKIPAEERRIILEAAAQAPTAGNQMLYTILEITDPALKATLAETCDQQPFIAKAPLVLLFLADCRRWPEAYRIAGCGSRAPGCGDFLLAYADACIAAQNAVTAAESMGIGSCYIGDILENCEQHRELLHLPEYLVPAAMLVFGYPTQRQTERKKPERFPLEYIVQENVYTPPSDSKIVEMFQKQRRDLPGLDFQKYIAAFCERKYQADFALEMNRSARQYISQFLKEEQNGSNRITRMENE